MWNRQGSRGELPTYSSMAIASRDGSKVVVVAQNSGGWTAALDVAELLLVTTDGAKGRRRQGEASPRFELPSRNPIELTSSSNGPSYRST
jgi:hypothetical protein